MRDLGRGVELGGEVGGGCDVVGLEPMDWVAVEGRGKEGNAGVAVARLE